jgi:hypothetical protein
MWVKRVSLVLLVVIAVLVMAFGFRTKSHVDSFKSNLKSGASVEQLAKSADDLSGDVNLALAITNLPVINQIFNVAGVNFVPIKDEIRAVIEAVPLLVGADGPKRYLIAFQNSAEARGTGGILGAYAVVEFNKGSANIIQTGSNESLYKISRSKIPVEVPAEFLKLYGNNPAILQNSNLSPHFPYGAEIWLGLWKAKFGEQLDGVLAIDPSALSYVLQSTGPITLKSGEVISSENVVSETLQKAYKRFETDNHARKQYLVDIINATSAKITSGDFSKIGMAKAIKRGLIENRILLYSRDTAAEEKIASVRLGGFLNTTPNNEFRTVIQNIDASKLDYYLEKSVVVESKSCKKPFETQVRVKLRNTLTTAKGLPAYVLTRADKTKPANLVSGQHRFKLFIYGPTDSKLVSVSRDIRTNGLGGASTERGRPISVADVDLAPGQSENFLANFAGGVGKISFVDQPLVIPTELAIKGGC